MEEEGEVTAGHKKNKRGPPGPVHPLHPRSIIFFILNIIITPIHWYKFKHCQSIFFLKKRL
jgi:hypothetical protein